MEEIKWKDVEGFEGLYEVCADAILDILKSRTA